MKSAKDLTRKFTSNIRGKSEASKGVYPMVSHTRESQGKKIPLAGYFFPVHSVNSGSTEESFGWYWISNKDPLEPFNICVKKAKNYRIRQDDSAFAIWH